MSNKRTDPDVPIWQKIAKNRVYKQAKCSPELIDIVNQLHILAADKFDTELLSSSSKFQI